MEWAGLLLSCFSRRCCRAGSSSTAAAVAAAVDGRREGESPYKGPFLRAAIRARAARRGEEWCSSRVSGTNHPRAGATASLTSGAIQWPAIGGGSGQRR